MLRGLDPRFRGDDVFRCFISKEYALATFCRRTAMPKIVRFHETGGPEVLKLEELPLAESGAGGG